MLKRAYLSLTRRKSKVLILFIILFVVTTLILTTISINNATNTAEEFAKESIGSEVTLSADMGKAREEMKAGTETSTDETDKKGMIQNFTRPTINVEDALKIAKSKYITNYAYSFSTYANVEENGLELVESEVDKMGEVKLNSDDATNSDDAKSKMRGHYGDQNFEFKFDMKEMMSGYKSGDISVEAINNFNYLDEYTAKTLTLTEGEAFSETDENVAIISYELAELNSLKVGDSITLLNTEDSEKITLKVVGIYDLASSEDEGNNFMMNNSNNIYTNVATGEKFLTEESYNEENYTIDNCVYYLSDPNNYEAFIKEANTLVTDLEDKNLTLSIDQTTYDKMVGAISEVGNFSNIIFWVVIGATVLIITLVINSQVKERNYEIGVLLSLGEKKGKIVLQVLIELLITITIAIILATFVGSMISGVIGDKLLANQIEISKDQEQTDMRMQRVNSKSSTQTIDELDVSVGITEIGMLVGIGYLLVIISMGIPMVQIIKYDPKTILTRRE